MRRSPTKKIERYRVTHGPFASQAGDGANGIFLIPIDSGEQLNVMASDGSDWSDGGLPGDPWEHVSVSLHNRCPTYSEMDFVKRLFWRDDETVMQLHVPRDRHVNKHPFCLHLWRPIGLVIPLPPQECV